MSTFLPTKRNIFSIFAAILIFFAIAVSSVAAAGPWTGTYNFGFGIPGSSEVYPHADAYIAKDAEIDYDSVSGQYTVKITLKDSTIINSFEVSNGAGGFTTVSPNPVGMNYEYTLELDNLNTIPVKLDIIGHPGGAMLMDLLFQ